MSLRKEINEHFFDKESKKMYYVLGTFYNCYIPIEREGMSFTSHNLDLVEIVRSALDSKHTIVSDTREKNSHWFKCRSIQHMNLRLREMGIYKDKSERIFPRNIKEYFLDHLIRGIIDSRAVVGIDDGRTDIRISYNNQFLVDLNECLRKYAGVERDNPKTNELSYGAADCSKIYSLIYRDWGFIKKTGLYLKCNKEKFIPYIPYDWSSYTRTIEYHKKIERAKRLLLNGKRIIEVTKEVGYSHIENLHRAFKNKTGKTIGEFLRENRA